MSNHSPRNNITRKLGVFRKVNGICANNSDRLYDRMDLGPVSAYCVYIDVYVLYTYTCRSNILFI